MGEKKVKKYRVIVIEEYEDGSSDEVSVYRFDHCEALNEYGWDLGKPSGLKLAPQEPNGQHRVTLKLWGGMEKFEDLKQGEG